jgi:hypothetical protein
MILRIQISLMHSRVCSLLLRGFKEGNYEKVTINTRNAIYNDLTELRQVAKKREYLKRHLRNDDVFDGFRLSFQFWR